MGEDTDGLSSDPEASPGSGSEPFVSRSAPHPVGISADRGRFAAGTLIGDRYRIIELLGRGGLGEVYRAEDLKLELTVALKFLPERFERDPKQLEFLINEVRTARRITHANVCRIYDIAEICGRHCVSMEYVDGETLSALLRRIGRLPATKAIQIARELCAGLGAAHDVGILHGDIKPGNVMIDGQGRVRIMDFGLARFVEQSSSRDRSGGTPAYMAPEQVAGGVLTLQSDLYALGLVLYEVFTGRRAYPSALRRLLAETSLPVAPSSLDRGLSLDVDRVVLRCLSVDPRDRPASAFAVSGALPGSDPFAVARDAGATLSPQVVAQARLPGQLTLGAAWGCAIASVVGLSLVVLMSSRTQLAQVVPLARPAVELAAAAREIAESVGYRDPRRTAEYGFRYEPRLVARLDQKTAVSGRRDVLDGAELRAVLFWYRLGAPDREPESLRRGYGLWAEPAPGPEAGDRLYLELAPDGRLHRLRAAPSEAETFEETTSAPWPSLFAWAGLRAEDLTPVEPRRSSRIVSDASAAWIGNAPGFAEPVHIEAAAFGQRPVFFALSTPGHDGASPPEADVATRSRRASLPRVLWLLAAVVGGAMLAYRNWRLQRLDLFGAFVVASLVLAQRLLVWAVEVLPEDPRIDNLEGALVWGFYIFALAWIFYVAAEPYVRRFWPETLVSWIRVLEGRTRDPLVGRDVLVGVLLGLFLVVSDQLYLLLPRWLGLESPPSLVAVGKTASGLHALAGFRAAIGEVLRFLEGSVWSVLGTLVLLLLLRVALRRDWAALALAFALGTVIANPSHGPTLAGVMLGAAQMAGFLAVLNRVGILAAMVGMFLFEVFSALPMTFELWAWYSGIGLLGLGLGIGLTIYGFMVSLGDRPLVADSVLD